MIEDLRTVRANRETNNRKQKCGEINNKYRGKCIQIENLLLKLSDYDYIENGRNRIWPDKSGRIMLTG